MSKEISAYIDRITEQNQAVIIAEEIGREFIIDTHDSTISLTSGTWLRLVLTEQNDIESFTIDEQKTAEKRASIGALHNKLKSKQRSKFRRK